MFKKSKKINKGIFKYHPLGELISSTEDTVALVAFYSDRINCIANAHMLEMGVETKNDCITITSALTGESVDLTFARYSEMDRDGKVRSLAYDMDGVITAKRLIEQEMQMRMPEMGKVVDKFDVEMQFLNAFKRKVYELDWNQKNNLHYMFHSSKEQCFKGRVKTDNLDEDMTLSAAAVLLNWCQSRVMPVNRAKQKEITSDAITRESVKLLAIEMNTPWAERNGERGFILAHSKAENEKSKFWETDKIYKGIKANPEMF